MKNRIMFRVYCMYAWRKLKSPFVAESIALGVLSFIFFMIVSVPSVISNTLASQDIFGYFLYAFSGTGHLVQVLLVLAGCTVLYSAKTLAFKVGLKPRFA